MPDVLITPGEFLASITAKSEEGRTLALLTGDSYTGKTRWCFDLLRQARLLGWQVTGVLSPAVFQNGQKVGIDLMNVASGERRRLAVRRDDMSPDFQSPPGFPTLNWRLDPGVLAWGNQILVKMDAGALLLIDELGPLELLENYGLTAGVQRIDEGGYQTACVVVRPGLLAAAQSRWPAARVIWPANLPPEGCQS